MRRSVLALAACLLAAAPALVPAGAAPADPDRTLTPAAYVAKGLPPLNKRWGEPEYSKASDVIRALTIDQLPRLSSARSAAVIVKLDDASGLAHCQDKKVNPRTRMADCAKLLSAALSIFGRYAGEAQKHPSLNDTTMRLGDLMLRLAAVVAQLGEQVKPLLDKKAPDYALRLSGLEQMRTGLLQMFSGGGSMVSERKTYSVAERRRFAAMLAKIYPAVAPSLTAEGREALETQYRRAGQEDPDPAIKASLANIGKGKN